MNAFYSKLTREEKVLLKKLDKAQYESGGMSRLIAKRQFTEEPLDISSQEESKEYALQCDDSESSDDQIWITLITKSWIIISILLKR